MSTRRCLARHYSQGVGRAAGVDAAIKFLVRIRSISIAVTALFLPGCGSATIHVEVIRPATFNVRAVGGTLSVAPVVASNIDWAPAAAEIEHELKRRILDSDAAIPLVENAGSVRVHATVIDHTFDDTVSRTPSTCSSTLGPARECSHNRRAGRARLVVGFSVSLADSRIIWTRTFASELSRATFADDQEPPAIDGPELLLRLRQRLLDQFSRVILPWRDSIEVRNVDCDISAQALCERGWAEMVAGHHELAVQRFEAAVAISTRLEEQPGNRSRTLLNLARAYEFSGRWDEAQDAIGRGLALYPESPDLLEEQHRLDSLRGESLAVEDQLRETQPELR